MEHLFYKTKDKEIKLLEKLVLAGKIDKNMIAHIEKINKLPGIFTTVCCEGHRAHKGNRCVNNGYVGIALNRSTLVKLFKDVSRLPNFMADSYMCFNNGSSILYIYFKTKSIKQTDSIMEKNISRIKASNNTEETR